MKKKKVKVGDVIGVSRGIYKHYAIFAGRGQVIHYASERGDFGGEMSVRKTSLVKFLDNSEDFFVCVFPEEYGKPKEKQASLFSLSGLCQSLLPGHFDPESVILEVIEFFKKARYKIYSPAETLKRAKSRIDENSYNLLFNNCEHFVIWCKTGISESHQINELVKLIIGKSTVIAGL